MKHTFLLLMVLVFFPSLFVACDKENSGDEDLKVSALVPIKLGNSWTYKETHYHSYFDVQETTIDTFSQTVTGPYSINGVNYYSMEDSKEIQFPNYTRLLFGNDAYGNMMTYGGFSNIDTLIFNSVYLKKNATSGEVWTTSGLGMNYEDYSFIENPCTFKCISTDTLITTPKGNFHCMAFEDISEEEYLSRFFITVNIGVIKVESFESDRLMNVRELIDYKVY